MGIKCVTDDKPVTVIRKDGVGQNGKAYTMYSLMYSFKNSNEDWKNVFVDAQFRKGTDLANKTKINISNAFLTGSEYNGNTKPKIFETDRLRIVRQYTELETLFPQSLDDPRVPPRSTRG